MRYTAGSAARVAGTGAPHLHDGIHLDFRFDSAREHYVKAINGAATKAAFASLFTFTGDADSYYMGPAGLLIPSVVDTPRIEYSAAGQLIGLKIEAGRTNLVTHSSDGTNAAWVKSNCTAAKTATGPDGVANSGTTLTATAGNATCLQSLTSASATRSNAVWLRRRTGTGNIDMTVDNGTTWTTKTITSSWARYSITQAAVTNPIYGLRIVTSGDEADFWNEQLEDAPFSSSDIPTGAAAVARAADVAIRTLDTEFSATAGTFAIRFVTASSSDATANQFVLNFDDGTLNERIGIQRMTGTSTYRLNVTDGGVNQVANDNTFATASSPARIAAAWSANDFAVSMNGGAIVTDATGTLPTVTTLRLGHRATPTDFLNGHILSFDYWPVRQPNGFLTSW